MSEADLGPRKIQPPLGADPSTLAQWAANEVSQHEQICGLRYEAINKEMKSIREAMDGAAKTAIEAVDSAKAAAAERTKAIEDKIGSAVKWVFGIVGVLGVSLFMQSRSAADAKAATDAANAQAQTARINLLTERLQQIQGPHPVVINTAGGGPVTANPSATPDPSEMDAATGGDPAQVRRTEPQGK